MQEWRITDNSTYDPEFFNQGRDSRNVMDRRTSRAAALSWGWSQKPAAHFENRLGYTSWSQVPGLDADDRKGIDPWEPRIKLNDSAFRDIRALAVRYRHETWHRIQNEHSSIYFGKYDPRTGRDDGWMLREADARLRDLENRNGPFHYRLNTQEKFSAVNWLDGYFTNLNRDNHWQRLSRMGQFGEVFCGSLKDRHNAVRKAVWNEVIQDILPGSKGWVPPLQKFSQPKPLMRSLVPSTLDILRDHLYRAPSTLDVLRDHLYRQSPAPKYMDPARYAPSTLQYSKGNLYKLGQIPRSTSYGTSTWQYLGQSLSSQR
jgi:hypothetical protein